MDKKAPPPKLSDREWSAVAEALEDARTCKCKAEPDWHRGLLNLLASLIFKRLKTSAAPQASANVVRRFICASSARSPIATELKPELERIGFTRDQIAAMEILSR